MTQEHPDNSANAPLPDDLLIDVVDTFKALSDPTRAQLVYLLTASSIVSTTWPTSWTSRLRPCRTIWPNCAPFAWCAHDAKATRSSTPSTTRTWPPYFVRHSTTWTTYVVTCQTIPILYRHPWQRQSQRHRLSIQGQKMSDAQHPHEHAHDNYPDDHDHPHDHTHDDGHTHDHEHGA